MAANPPDDKPPARRKRPPLRPNGEPWPMPPQQHFSRSTGTVRVRWSDPRDRTQAGPRREWKPPYRPSGSPDQAVAAKAFSLLWRLNDLPFSMRVAVLDAIRVEATPKDLQLIGHTVTWPMALCYLEPEVIVSVVSRALAHVKSAAGALPADPRAEPAPTKRRQRPLPAE